MKNVKRIAILLLGIILLLTGCEVAPAPGVESKSDPSLSDEDLLGTWKETMGKDDPEMTVLFSFYKDNSFSLDIETNATDGEASKDVFEETGFYAVDGPTLLLSMNENSYVDSELYKQLEFNYELMENFNYSVTKDGKKLTLVDGSKNRLEFTKEE